MFFGRAAGLGASLAKDVPFAALYWMMLEPMRRTLMEHDYSTLADSFWQNQNINELSGKRCCAGIGIISANTMLVYGQDLSCLWLKPFP